MASYTTNDPFVGQPMIMHLPVRCHTVTIKQVVSDKKLEIIDHPYYNYELWLKCKQDYPEAELYQLYDVYWRNLEFRKLDPNRVSTIFITKRKNGRWYKVGESMHPGLGYSLLKEPLEPDNTPY